MATTVQRSRSKALWVTLIAIAIAAAVAVVWFFIAGSKGSTSQIPTSVLPEGTEVGAVHLTVQDLELMRSYYEVGVGLQVIEESDDRVTLGSDRPLIVLDATSEGEAFVSPTEAGLYHSAILYDSETSLANVIANLAGVAPGTFQGSADHAVSLAFYFVDPEGNGLELYVDTPESSWKWIDGEVQMGSAPLDPYAFIRDHASNTQDLAKGAIMGHVHLKVGNLADAEAFYGEVLGFAVTARSNGALFYSAAGYHHHVATNVWQSEGAGSRVNPTGLASLTVIVPDGEALQGVRERLTASGASVEEHDGGLTAQDPWGNLVHLVIG